MTDSRLIPSPASDSQTYRPDALFPGPIDFDSPDPDLPPLNAGTAAPSYAPRLNNVRGILWMIAAVTLLSTMFVVIKQMTLELPIFVVALARTFFSLSLMTPWVARNGLRGIKTRRIKEHIFRGVCGTGAFLCVVAALQHLLLADVMVLAFTAPFWSIIISIIVLHEVVRGRRIAATVVGFCGVLMIVKPQGGIEPMMLLALFSALLTSLAMITMKRLSATEPPSRIVFYFMLTGTLVLLPPAIYTWQTPNLEQLAWLIFAGTLGFAGQECLARAYDAGEVSIVAPFDFVRLPISAFFGWLVFNELPDEWSIAGTVIIICAAVYLMRRGSREQREMREAAAKAGNEQA